MHAGKHMKGGKIKSDVNIQIWVCFSYGKKDSQAKAACRIQAVIKNVFPEIFGVSKWPLSVLWECCSSHSNAKRQRKDNANDSLYCVYAFLPASRLKNKVYLFIFKWGSLPSSFLPNITLGMIKYSLCQGSFWKYRITCHTHKLYVGTSRVPWPLTKVCNRLLLGPNV